MDEVAAVVFRDDGMLVFDDVIVGRFDRESSTLKLNLGWCREAGLHVKVLADPEVDRKRSGVVLER